MDETAVSHKGQKRRLPPWMLGVAAVNSETKEVNDIVINEEKGVGSPSRQTKLRSRRAAQLEKETLISHNADLDADVDGSSLLVKCESKKTKRKVINKEVKRDGNTQETKDNLEVGEPSLGVKCESKRMKRKIGKQEEESCNGEVRRRTKESAPKKRRRTKRSFESSNEEIEDTSSNEDDGDLTMEDLMSIAKEFVKDENNEGKQQPSDEEKHKDQTQFADVDASLNAHQSNTRVTINKETDSRHNSAKTSTVEGVLGYTRMTGDPAQDMLDLFLGPLLKSNPLENDNKKVELITADMRFAHESKMQKQKDVCGGEPVVPLMKKKSSLRDKVAAFLD